MNFLQSKIIINKISNNKIDFYLIYILSKYDISQKNFPVLFFITLNQIFRVSISTLVNVNAWRQIFSSIFLSFFYVKTLKYILECFKKLK